MALNAFTMLLFYYYFIISLYIIQYLFNYSHYGWLLPWRCIFRRRKSCTLAQQIKFNHTYLCICVCYDTHFKSKESHFLHRKKKLCLPYIYLRIFIDNKINKKCSIQMLFLVVHEINVSRDLLLCHYIYFAMKKRSTTEKKISKSPQRYPISWNTLSVCKVEV